MAKYSSFLFVASICCFTALCVSTASAKASDAKPGTPADFFNRNVTVLLQEVSDIDKSSNIFVKLFRTIVKKYIDSFDTDKKKLRDAVAEGTEHEKQIQNITNTLKTFTNALPTELQSQIEETVKHAAAELKKLKEMENVNDIDEMQKKAKDKYAIIKEQTHELAKLGLTVEEGAKGAGEKPKAEPDKTSETVNTKLLLYFKNAASFAYDMTKNADTLSKKRKVTKSALSNIHDDLIKVEQIEYHLLKSQKEYSKADAAFSIRSSSLQFVFAILFGILF